MSKPYTPNTGSLADRVCAYFLANPGDELEPFDITVKYGVSNIHNVRAQLQQAVDAGLLVQAFNADGAKVYGPGRDIERLRPAAAPTKHLPAKRGQGRVASDEDYSTTYQPPVVSQNPLSVSQNPPSVSQNPTAVSPVKKLSLDDFVIEDGIPLPPNHTAEGRTALMRSLLAYLKPGQSTRLPLNFHAVLSHAISKSHKQQVGKFSIRTNRKADTLRVWRVA